MRMPIEIQAGAAICVLAALCFAELAGLALARSPASAELWQLNLGVLGSLRPGMQALSNALGLAGLPLVGFLGALIALVLAAAYARIRVATALSANLALILCIAFFMLWHGRGGAEVASLSIVVTASRDATVLWMITGIAAIGSLTAHIFYLHRVVRLARAGARRR
jgi:hypothetical protein